MGEIISRDVFEQKRKQRARKKEPTTAEIQATYDEIIHFVSCEWELHFRRGTLSELFDGLLGKEYGNVLDVEVVKQIEKDLSINPVIFSPGSMPLFGADGWVAGFSFNNINYATPPMLEEAYARALNVLLFLELKQHRDNTCE